MRLVRVVTVGEGRQGEESVEFDAAKIILRHKPEGLAILPKAGTDNQLGFLCLFYPWNEIRQIKEFDKNDG